MSENNKDNQNDWDFEAEQNWVNFWNLLLQEDIRQNPEFYKKINNQKQND